MWKLLGKIFMAMSNAPIRSEPINSPVNGGISSPNIAQNIEIQMQDINGNWRTMQVVQNIPALIISGMRQVQSQFPGHRVRAVDSNSRVVDIL